MKGMKVFLLIIIVAFLSGCADSSTSGTEKDTDLKVTINVTQYANNTGNVNINPGVDYASATGDTKQDTANTAETPTKVDLNLDDVNNPVTKITQAVDDKVKSNVSEKVTEIAGPADLAPDPAPAAGYKHRKNYTMHEMYHDGRPFYRLGQPGELFGKSILIVGDTDGKEFFIPDTDKDTGDKAQQFFFNGSGEVEHTFDGNASLFWFKGGSESVTVHYNK